MVATLDRTAEKSASRVLEADVMEILGDALQIEDFTRIATRESALFGVLPEFDSMAVVTVLTMLEDEFGIVIHDDEVSADVFATVASLTEFVAAKVQR